MWVSRMIKTSCNKAAGSTVTEAYPLGRTVRRIRSTTFVRAAESVRRPGPRENAVRWRFHHPERGRRRVGHRLLR